MDDSQKPRHTAEEKGTGIVAWVGIVVAALLILFLVWWLPARVASGYAVPRITGSVASLPSRIPVLWVRSWPWQTTPPNAQITFDLANGKHVTAAARGSAPSVGWLSGRAVPAALVLQSSPRVQADQIVGIQVQWSGGSSSAAEPALWISAPTGTPAAPGAKVVWADQLSPQAHVGIEVPLGTNADVISVSTPNPALSPWTTALCVAVPSGPAEESVRSALLEGKLPEKAQPCGSLKTGDAVVLTSMLPKTYGFFVWQPVVQEVINTHIRTLVAGPVEIASEQAMTSQNWWKFTAAPLPPGF